MQTQTPLPGGASSPRLHPLIVVAAVAVIALCTVGVAAIMGWLPHSSATDQPGQAASQATAPAPAAAPVPPPTAAAPSRAAAPSTTAAAPKPAAAPAPAQRAAAAPCATCGTVAGVRTVQVPAPASGNAISDNNVVGTVAGGVVGGVVGNQIGGGSGRTAMTVLGALGGALAGHEIERNMKPRTVTQYELTVRMDDGGSRVFRSQQPFAYASGDRVRVDNDQLLPL